MIPKKFQDFESVCSSRLSHVLSRPEIVSSLCGVPSRDHCQRLDTRNLLGISGDVFGNSAAPIASTTSIQKGLLHGKNPVSSFDGSVFLSTGKPVARVRSEEVIKDTIPTPRFARKSSTWNPPSYAEGVYYQNYMVDHQRLEISELHFDKFPTPSTFSCWKIRFQTEVCACSRSPSKAMLRIKEVQMVDSVDDLKSSRSVQGQALNKFIPISYF